MNIDGSIARIIPSINSIVIEIAPSPQWADLKLHREHLKQNKSSTKVHNFHQLEILRCSETASRFASKMVASQYIADMVLRSSRGRPRNAPAAFIHPCQPTVATKPPSGPGWAHELKHDGYRLQIHVRDGRVRLYTMNGADWSKRYPLIIDAGRATRRFRDLRCRGGLA